MVDATEGITRDRIYGKVDWVGHPMTFVDTGGYIPEDLDIFNSAVREQAQEAIEAGADAVGMEDLSEKIKKGEDDFDVVIATPDTMKLVSPLGKILGPKGTMPNPKTGTVTKDIGKAVKNAKAGQIRYRADKSGIIHGRIGDLSYSSEQIQQNIETLLTDLKRNKPASSKGVFIKKLSITSTMGAGIELDMASLSF